MKRRSFLTGLALISAMPLMAHAEDSELSIGIFPGAANAERPQSELRAEVMPLVQALAGALGVEPRLTLFRNVKNTIRSMEKGRFDLYFVPPTVAVSALDNGYSPVARVKEPLTGALVRRKGATVTAVVLAEKESWLDVMGRYVLKRNKLDLPISNVRTVEDVVKTLERGLAEAGSVSPKATNELVAKGTYEIWHPLPSSPGFTLMVSDRLTENEQNKLGGAAVALKPEAIQALQKALDRKVGSFVIDRQADFKTIKQAVKEAGYD